MYQKDKIYQDVILNVSHEPPTKPLPPLTWQELLLKAADVIERRGWTRGTVETTGGSVCAVGAILVVLRGNTNSRFLSHITGDETIRDKADAALVVLAMEKCRQITDSMGLMYFNDCVARIPSDVTRVLRTTAQIVR